MLVICPPPYGDECMAGYLRRISEANGFCDARPLKLLSAVDDLPTPLAEARTLLLSSRRSIRALIGITEQQLRARTSDSPKSRFISADTQRYCPCCLMEAPYWRAHWGHVFVTHCQRHRVPLLDHCPACRGRVRAVRSRLLICDCGESLAKPHVSDDVPPQVIALQTLLLSRLGIWHQDAVEGIAQWPPQIEALTAGQLEKLILFLGAYLHGEAGPRPRKLKLSSDRISAVATVKRAAMALEHWPKSFESLLANQQADRAMKSGLYSTFGAVYRIAYREFAEPGVAFLQNAFEEYLSKDWQGSRIDGRNRKVGKRGAQRQPYLAAPYVMSRCGVSRAALRNLAVAGCIDARIVTTQSGRERIEVARKHLRKVIWARKTMSLECTAQFLGITERRVRELVARDQLSGTAPRQGEPWQIPQHSPARLLNKLAGVAVNEAVPADGLSLPTLLKYSGQRRIDAGVLVHALLLKRLSVWVNSDAMGLGRFEVSRKEFRAWFDRQTATISVVEAAKILGVKDQVAYHWINQGLLPVSRCEGAGRRVRIDDLEAFGKDHVLASRLAMADRTSAKALIGRLSAKGVRPISGPGIDGGRQALYLRQAVAQASDRWLELLSRTKTGA